MDDLKAHETGGGNRALDPESNTAVLADYITREQLAEQLGRSPRTLRNWEWQRTGPPCTRVGHDVYYHIPDVKAWLAERADRRKSSRAARQKRGRR